jgi:hypothetical protein
MRKCVVETGQGRRQNRFPQACLKHRAGSGIYRMLVPGQRQNASKETPPWQYVETPVSMYSTFVC